MLVGEAAGPRTSSDVIDKLDGAGDEHAATDGRLHAAVARFAALVDLPASCAVTATGNITLPLLLNPPPPRRPPPPQSALGAATTTSANLTLPSAAAARYVLKVGLRMAAGGATTLEGQRCVSYAAPPASVAAAGLP